MFIYDLLESNEKTVSQAIDDYVYDLQREYHSMPYKQARDTLLSEYNYHVRSRLKSCRCFGMTISPGDFCYIDFGKAYLSEAGYQHFGFVLNVFNSKAFVIPMTSNENTCRMAYDEKTNPQGLRHLMRIGRIDGLYRDSVLFLNDGKYINTARIIDIKGHIDPDSPLFREIHKRFIETLRVV